MPILDCPTNKETMPRVKHTMNGGIVPPSATLSNQARIASARMAVVVPDLT